MNDRLAKPSLSPSEKSYVFLSSSFVGILVLTNVIGTKLFVLFGEALPQGLFATPLVLTSGIITYPLTFWLTDVVSEIWGRRRANYMIIIGFFFAFLMLGVISLAKTLPPAEVWQVSKSQAAFFHPDHYIQNSSGEVLGVSSQAAQAAFRFTFDAPGLLLFASMLAYLIAQLFDTYLFHFFRRLTQGRYLWLRNNASTAISQFIDTIIVNGIFLHFYWQLPWLNSEASQGVSIIQIIFTVYICKVVIALLDTPLIYAAVHFFTRFLADKSLDKNK